MENLQQTNASRVGLNTYFFQQAYEPDSKVVYVSSLIPSEIFFAMDLIPFNLGVIGGIFAQANASHHFINKAGEQGFGSDLCTTCRCTFGAAHDDTLPNPDFLVATTEPCDVGIKIYQNLALQYGKGHYLIDIPYDNNEESLGYLVEQLKELVSVLETTFDRKLDHEKLKSAIHYSNQSNRNLKTINEFAKSIPSPISPIEMMEMVSSYHLLGSKDMTDVTDTMVKDIQSKCSSTVPKNRKPRVFWYGLRPYYNDKIFDRLQSEFGIEIISASLLEGMSPLVFEDMSTDDPMLSLAKKIKQITGSGPLDQILNARMNEKIDEFNIDGVILFTSRGCRYLISIQQIMREVLSKSKINYLEIEGDYIDAREDTFERIKTRLDTFIELLNGE